MIASAARFAPALASPRVPCARCVCDRRPELAWRALAVDRGRLRLTVRGSRASARSRPRRDDAGEGPRRRRSPGGLARPALMIVVLQGALGRPARSSRWASRPRPTTRAGRAERYAAQQQVLIELAAHGLGVRPDYSFARVLDGFSASLDPRAVALLEQDPEVDGVYPVRAAFPATSQRRRCTGRNLPAQVCRCPVSTARGVTIALLDTGVDSVTAVPARQRRARDRHRRSVGRRQMRSRARRTPTSAKATAPSSRGCSSARVARTGSTASRRRRRCCRSASPAGSPTRPAQDVVYARSDQLIAGLDRAVDPNGDGDTHDAARVARDRRHRAVSPRSPTGPRRWRSPARSRSTCSSWCRPGTTAPPDRPSARSLVPAARRRH